MANVVAEPSISAVVVLDQQGERIAARYFSDDLQTLANQQVFEKALLAKALKTSTTVGPRLALPSSSSSLLLSSLELSDTKVYAPQIRALLGTAAHFCEVVVLKLRTPGFGFRVPGSGDLLGRLGLEGPRLSLPSSSFVFVELCLCRVG